ncbi:HAMP domain-containing histidine kinase [Metabacillus sediminilitoris]|uniref:histidine kinase n=1 Tax=Metabacillus sediminilitoris TaxID=2567941 RepID=A0A4S4C014_9BACI|nr:HAMP domain-containing histidine kinase [Metabacillus sediminilitoris]QGQ48002.1 sensor histidine kinase [Metabacillus sediminilitoris]THF80886.1 HAMP domain-containing histidine kinase [Metabacillus sediminilitoris]
MKLFIRDHISLTFFYFVQLGVMILIFWLDGYKNQTTILYACFLSTCIFAGYLFYRFVTNKSFYKRLSTPISSLNDLSIELQSAPLPESLHHFQRQQIQNYQQELHKYKHKLDHHIQFINQWVHQMKTPISVIHLSIQDIEDDDLFESIDVELDRLKKGLEMVLFSSRLDHFERDFHVETINLNSLIRELTSNQKRLFIRNRVYPELSIDPSITITSDEKWLSFVISQLITNAVRYTVEKGRKIVFRGRKDETKTVLEVIDEGIGIPKSDLPRVFDPYFTGENGRAFQESTGMGLYLVKQICEKLGHHVDIESDSKSGTVVRISF